MPRENASRNGDRATLRPGGPVKTAAFLPLPDAPQPPSPDYCAFAAQATLERLARLKAEVHGVKQARDIEHVHRMRVASRRVRTALRLFEDCFPRKPLKNWMREIRAVTRALGEARDLDVQIAAVRAFIDRQRAPVNRPGVRRLLLRRMQKRARVQRKVIVRIEELQTCGVVEDMESVLAPLAAQGTRTDPPADLTSAAAGWIRRGLDELLEYETFVVRPKAVRELHAMRIAAKHLRYCLEVCEPLFGPRLDAPLQAARQVQSLLGELHDCDVWLEFLPRFRDKEQRRCRKYHGHNRAFQRLLPGIEQFRSSVRQRRGRTYRRFRTFWEQTRQQHLWEALRAIAGEA
jgi:CHAD domain-containing protein